MKPARLSKGGNLYRYCGKEFDMVEEDKKTMDEIKNYLISMLKRRYGYCGVAQGPTMVMINSGKGHLTVEIVCKE